MKTQFNQEFTFERELLLMGNDWDTLTHDREVDALLQDDGGENDVTYFSNTLMWEELEGVNKFIDAAGY